MVKCWGWTEESKDRSCSVVWWNNTETKFTLLHHCHLLSIGATEIKKRWTFLEITLKRQRIMTTLDLQQRCHKRTYVCGGDAGGSWSSYSWGHPMAWLNTLDTPGDTHTQLSLTFTCLCIKLWIEYNSRVLRTSEVRERPPLNLC